MNLQQIAQQRKDSDVKALAKVAAIWPFGKGQPRTIDWDQSDLNKELWEAGKIYVDEDDDTPYYSHGSPLTKKLRLVDGAYRDFPGKGQFQPKSPRAKEFKTLEMLARIKNIRGETAGPEYHSKEIIPWDEWNNMGDEGDDWENVWFVNQFKAKGFTDVQDAGDGNYKMKDPHGNPVEWDHETNSMFPATWDPISELEEKSAADEPLSWNPGVIRDAKWLNKKQEKARIGHNTGQYPSGTTNWLDHLLRMPSGNAPTIEAPRGIGLPADVPKAHGNPSTSNDPRSHMTSAELGAHNKGASAEDMPYQFSKSAQLGRLAAMEKMASLGMLLGGTIGAGIGRHRAGEGDDVRRATARGAVRGGFTGSGATIGGGLGLLGSLALMKGEPSTTKGIISALLPLLGAGVGGYGGYLAGDSLLDDDDKATELEDLRRDNSSEEYKE